MIREAFRKFPFLSILIVLAAMVTAISLTVYASVQQAYRQSANDPQIEAAMVIAEVLAKGTPADAILGQGSDVDIPNSLSLFINLYDKEGKLLGGQGKVDGQVPTPPSGVFANARAEGQKRLTWEPKEGVRIAAVAQKADDQGFVVVGRSLKEVEARMARVTQLVGLSWIVLLALSTLLAWILSMLTGPLTVIEENILEVTADSPTPE